MYYYATIEKIEASRKIRGILSEQARFLTMVGLVEKSILIICSGATEQRWNYLERRVESIMKFVEGKGKLKEKIAALLSNYGLIGPSSSFHRDNDQWNEAFEDALGRLIASGLIVEQQENLVFANGSYRLKKYKITPKGLESLKDDSYLTVNLKRLIA